MFTKSRQLILIGSGSEKIFVDTPGWLYHYEPLGIDVFIHRKVILSNKYGYRLDKTWRVSDINTGLSLLTFVHARTRKEAVKYLYDRLADISLKIYNEAVWNKLAESPPHKASWRFTTIRGISRNIAVEVNE